jgi:hypothetical protein
MQVNTQPFPINIIELASKKILVRIEVADKGKGKNIIIGDPRTSNISQVGIARKALDKKTNKSGGVGGRLNRATEKSSPTRASRTIWHLRGRSAAHADGLADSSRQSAHGQRRWTPHKVKKGMQGQSTCNAHGQLVKVGPTFDQLLFKYTSKKVVLRDRPTKKPRLPTKTKRSNKTA